jgi:Domain of unknown function (DUF4037)
MDRAREIAHGYRSENGLLALTVAGSVGAGLADRWSDLELDCYWWKPPSESERRAPLQQVGAADVVVWDYDPTEREWSEDYRVGGLAVNVSNFTADTVEGFLECVIDHADTDPVKHMRLAAIQRCAVLRGGRTVDAWRARAAEYPDALVDAMLAHWLRPCVLDGWEVREAWVERDDAIALHALLAGIELAIIGSVLALSRVYMPHRHVKWQRALLSGCAITPARLSERLASMWQPPLRDGLASAESLLGDVVALAGQHSRAELTPFRKRLGARRSPIDP